MSAQKYSVNHHPIQTLLTWIRSEEIAIPEIQRPFVWEPVKVRDLLDSLKLEPNRWDVTEAIGNSWI